MNFRIDLLLWVVVFALACPAWAVRNIKVGDSLSRFSLPRADGVEGFYESGQLAGQPAAIIFWRPNHKFSIEALRDLQTVVLEVGASRFTILAVDAKRSTTQEVQTALAEESFSFPILLDPQQIMYETVGLIVCPTTLLFDGNGILRFVISSHPRQFPRVVQARLRFLLGEIDEQTMNEQVNPTTVNIEPDLTAAWRTYNLGKKFQTEGKLDKARSAYEKAVSHHATLIEAHCALGYLELKAGYLQTAGRHFKNALACQADSSAAQLGQAAVWVRTGKTQQAQQILVSLLGKQHSMSIDVRIRYELGRVYYMQREFEKAATYYQDALSQVFAESKPGASKSDGAQAEE